MKTFFKAVVLVSVTLTLFACGYREGVETPDRSSFLYFTGFTDQVVVMVDNVPLDPQKKMTSKDRYQIQPGEHLVEVRHGGRTLVRRQIYVSDGSDKEIHIPRP
jgi:hypothetical protein